jgi:hypothetical protein
MTEEKNRIARYPRNAILVYAAGKDVAKPT